MGKAKKRAHDKLKRGGDKKQKTDNLEVTLREDLAKQSGVVQPTVPRSTKQRHRAESDDEMDASEVKKVSFLAKGQREEVAREEADEFASRARARAAAVALDKEESDDDGSVDLDDGDDGEAVDEGALEDVVGAEALSESQAALVDSFLAPRAGQRRTLADIILQKIAEKENGMQAEEDDDGDELPEKVVAAYTGMIPLLQRYRCGKLPKAFKVIPALERWEDILWLVRPDLWSPHCAHAATRVFAANLDPKRARLFYGDVLLEKCRDDIRAHRKLHYHLYQALHKALFKPGPWFKGILLPLASGGDCTLREALIFGSVLAKASVPAAHAAVVLLKLASLEYSGAQSLFLIVLLNKKYALPVRVVSAVAKNFLKFLAVDLELPVLWHQSLLVFVQRYRADLDDVQSAGLLKLLKAHKHHTITHEIRRELVAGHTQRANSH